MSPDMSDRKRHPTAQSFIDLIAFLRRFQGAQFSIIDPKYLPNVDPKLIPERAFVIASEQFGITRRDEVHTFVLQMLLDRYKEIWEVVSSQIELLASVQSGLFTASEIQEFLKYAPNASELTCGRLVSQLDQSGGDTLLQEEESVLRSQAA